MPASSEPTPEPQPDALPGAGPDARSYRPGTSWLYAGGWAVLSAWWLGAPAVEGRWSLAAGALPGVLAAGAFVYAVLWQPSLAADRRGVLLRNVLREVSLPWSAVEGIETRFTLTLLAGGRRYQAWAAPARGGARQLRAAPRPPGLPADVTAMSSADALDADSGAAAYLLRQVRPQTSPSGEPGTVLVRLNRPAVAALAAAVVLGVVAVLV